MHRNRAFVTFFFPGRRFGYSVLPVPKLPQREIDICKRLRDARENVAQLSQAEAARQLGIKRERLLIYEYQRAPVRCDLALRFCRQFIISEEWLATGSVGMMEAAGLEKGLIKTGADTSLLLPIFRRQCLDLGSEEQARDVPMDALFSSAFDQFLSPIYRRLVAIHYMLPRVVFRDSDGAALVKNCFSAIMETWLKLLSNEARRLGREEGRVRREFLKACVEADISVFRQFMGFEKPLPSLAGKN